MTAASVTVVIREDRPEDDPASPWDHASRWRASAPPGGLASRGCRAGRLSSRCSPQSQPNDDGRQEPARTSPDDWLVMLARTIMKMHGAPGCHGRGRADDGDGLALLVARPLHGGDEQRPMARCRRRWSPRCRRTGTPPPAPPSPARPDVPDHDLGQVHQFLGDARPLHHSPARMKKGWHERERVHPETIWVTTALMGASRPTGWRRRRPGHGDRDGVAMATRATNATTNGTIMRSSRSHRAQVRARA